MGAAFLPLFFRFVALVNDTSIDSLWTGLLTVLPPSIEFAFDTPAAIREENTRTSAKFGEKRARAHNCTGQTGRGQTGSETNTELPKITFGRDRNETVEADIFQFLHNTIEGVQAGERLPLL